MVSRYLQEPTHQRRIIGVPPCPPTPLKNADECMAFSDGTNASSSNTGSSYDPAAAIVKELLDGYKFDHHHQDRYSDLEDGEISEEDSSPKADGAGNSKKASAAKIVHTKSHSEHVELWDDVARKIRKDTEVRSREGSCPPEKQRLKKVKTEKRLRTPQKSSSTSVSDAKTTKKLSLETSKRAEKAKKILEQCVVGLPSTPMSALKTPVGPCLSMEERSSDKNLFFGNNEKSSPIDGQKVIN